MRASCLLEISLKIFSLLFAIHSDNRFMINFFISSKKINKSDSIVLLSS
nr:MAG TPA: hypothetical protein [Caudoviricetes sp.]